MKITFITDEATQDPIEFCKLANHHKIDAVELRTVNDEHVIEMDVRSLTRLKEVLDSNALKVCCVSTPIFKNEWAGKVPLRDIELFRRSLDAAAFLQCPYIRVFSFLRSEKSVPGNERMVESFFKLLDILGNEPFTILIENGKKTFHSTGSALADLISAIGSEKIRALWDPGNSIFGGSDLYPLGEGFNKIQEYIRHVHIKDPTVYGAEKKYVPLGDGDLNVGKTIDLLKSRNFEGYISLETHWRPDRVFAVSELDIPGGSSFSKGGYYATSKSLERLQELTAISVPQS
jgi:L-ribulose-5-phosphate 3-epimerase